MDQKTPDTGPVQRAKPAFDQDPHRVRELSERNLEMAIGRAVKALSLIHI